ncbi:MAG: TetR/AcrR family transcriptional regulator [Pseudomonadota bacterium]
MAKGMQRAARKARGGGRLGTRKVPRDERMEHMLQVAAQVFAARGYHGASMAEIARVAGISKPLLYRYYGSKDGLYLALIERAGQRLLAGLERIKGEPDPLKRIDLGTAGLLDFVDRYRDLWLVLFNEATGGGSPVSRKIRDFRAQVIASTTVTISELLDERTPDGLRFAEAVTHAVYGAGEAIARWWMRHPEMPVEQIHELMLDYTLPSLRHLRDKRRSRRRR